MKVLYLTPWYPSERDAMAGLFVKKHADAVRAQGVEVEVLCSYTWSELLRGWHRLKRTWGLPDVVQLNVIQKQGLLALYLKRRYHIPYIIVEHWSGYLPENGQFMRFSVLKRRLFASIARNADRLLCVSRRLEEAMRLCKVTNADMRLVHNVVEEGLFESRKQKGERRKAKGESILLHVSCFDERAKNTFALLRGFSTLCARRSDVQLVMVGTGIDIQASQAMAAQLAIPSDRLIWTGEQTPEEVCAWMHRADAFVLTSRYETYGTVLAEAAAAGLPVLSTDVGIAEEIVSDGTGIILTQEAANDPARLAEAMEQVLAMPHYTLTGLPFTAGAVGTQLKEAYTQAMSDSFSQGSLIAVDDCREPD